MKKIIRPAFTAIAIFIFLFLHRLLAGNVCMPESGREYWLSYTLFAVAGVALIEPIIRYLTKKNG